MMLSLPIGRNSNNEIQYVDIKQTPHLFVTYCEPQQLAQCLTSIAGIHEYGKLVTFYLSLHSKHHPLFNDPNFFQEVVQTYYTDTPSVGKLRNRNSFIKTLYKEYKRRISLDPQKEHPPIIAVIDNIWDLIIRLTKRSSLQFLELLTKAQVYGIHMVMASPTTYRNLLGQVVRPGLSHQRILEKAGIQFPAVGITSVGSELIYTPEDMVFFKQQHSMEVVGFYKL